MRKQLAVLFLFVRSSILWMLLLFLLLAAAEIGWFSVLLRGLPDFSGAVDETQAYELFQNAGLEQLLASGVMKYPMLAALALACVQLMRVGSEKDARVGYTLRRLLVSEQTVFVWQWVCNAAFFFLLWVVQLALAFGLCTWYTRAADPLLVSEQTVFLAFVRDDLLHSLLPLGDVLLWVRNALFFLVLSGACALCPYRRRRGLYAWATYACVAYFLFRFPTGLSALEGMAVDFLFFTPLLLYICYLVWSRDENGWREEGRAS